MLNDLSARQQEVLTFIEDYQMQNGGSPTLREIREFLDVSSDNSVLKHLAALVKKGYIEKDDTPRGIKLLASVRHKLETETVGVPLLGYIPAGGPVATEEYVEDTISFDISALKHPKDSFCLRVTGDSMINAGIYEGDIVLADAKITPKSGDIVIALVDGGNTVKTYIREGGRIYLRAENPDYPDIFPERDLQIQGTVMRLMRNYR